MSPLVCINHLWLVSVFTGDSRGVPGAEARREVYVPGVQSRDQSSAQTVC